MGNENTFEGQAARGGDQRAGNAGEMVDFARHQRGCLDGARQLDQVYIESMFLENAGIFSDEESQKGQAKGGVADFDFLKFLGVGATQLEEDERRTADQ